MSMACSSVLRGGGTNQELVLHCLHECGGDILVSRAIQADSLNVQEQEKSVSPAVMCINPSNSE